MPDTTWPISRTPARLIPGWVGRPVSMSSNADFDTSSVDRSRSSSWPTPDALKARLAPRRSPPRLLTAATRGGLRPPPAGRPRRPTSRSDWPLHLRCSTASTGPTFHIDLLMRSWHTLPVCVLPRKPQPPGPATLNPPPDTIAERLAHREFSYRYVKRLTLFALIWAIVGTRAGPGWGRERLGRVGVTGVCGVRFGDRRVVSPFAALERDDSTDPVGRNRVGGSCWGLGWMGRLVGPVGGESRWRLSHAGHRVGRRLDGDCVAGLGPLWNLGLGRARFWRGG